MKLFNNHPKIQKFYSINFVRRWGRNPFADWALILFFSTVLGITLIVNAVYLHNTVSNRDGQSAENFDLVKLDTFDTKGLDSVIDKFNSKIESATQIKDNYKSVPDPSIL